VELLFKITGIVFHLQQSEHVEQVLEKAPGFAPFGPGVAVLDADKDDPGQPP
jgi:hypothetical protein